MLKQARWHIPEYAAGGPVDNAIGSLRYVHVPFVPGEYVGFCWPVGHVTGSFIDHGQLYMTNRRLVFTPHRIVACRPGAGPWAMDLVDVVAADINVAPAGNQLCVGDHHVFAMHDPNRVAQKIIANLPKGR
jgi:hypothetical protein